MTRVALQTPASLVSPMRDARRLQWWSLAAAAVVAVLLTATLGPSQAMKAAWLENVVRALPAAAWLAASRLVQRPPDARFPYGYVRAPTVGLLSVAVVFVCAGLYLAVDSLARLVMLEYADFGPTILAGEPVWSGWLMVAALVISALPPVTLSLYKRPLARALHQKPLYCAAARERTEWLIALVAVLGVLGTGGGFRWADAAAAALIGALMVRRGGHDAASAARDLLDQRPHTVARDETDPLMEEVRSAICELPWVSDVEMRMREEGPVLSGELFITPVQGTHDLMTRLPEAEAAARAVHWRVYDIVAAPRRHRDSA